MTARPFNTAMDLARLNEWEFNWRLVIADRTDHSPPETFDHPRIGNPLFEHRRTR